MEKKKGKSGRPKIKIDYDKVKELAGRGLKKRDICLCLGISLSLLELRQREDEKMNQAIESGKAQMVSAVSGIMLGFVKERNLKASMFWLERQAGWNKTEIIEHKKAKPAPESFEDGEAAEQAYFDTVREK